MSSLVLRKTILRGRAVEFSRLLMLSMLENAEDTFLVTLSLLESELSRCNLNVDEFFHKLTELIDELRLKASRKEEEEFNLATVSTSNANLQINYETDATNQVIPVEKVEVGEISDPLSLNLVKFLHCLQKKRVEK